MNTIILQPTDVLFFRDGRPMNGSLAGHGAAWPLPSVINSAFHMAMHRGFPVAKTDLNGNRTLHGDHVHRIVRSNEPVDAERHRRFGSLLTAGPFPVRVDAQGHPEKWLLPRPADLQDASLTPALMPVEGSWRSESSLPVPLRYAVANRLPPAKDSSAKTWLSRHAFENYLKCQRMSMDGQAWNDSDIFDAEAYLGIGIDPERQVQDGERIYSAHYLRLKDAARWRLGALAHCAKPEDESLFRQLFGNQPSIVVGGQQRVCTARCFDAEPNQALPLGVRNFNTCARKGTVLVKWVLLSPSIWPEIPDKDGEGKPICDRNGRPIQRHPGGWLPNWVDAETGRILLKHRTNRRREGRKLVGDGTSIAARLVAAVVPKPIIVTGWSLGDPFSSESSEREAGACSTHLAVPAGAVYYFEADSPEDAANLAAALNWHGSDQSAIRNPQSAIGSSQSAIRNPQSTIIKNRRSTLLGEKGFGLGVCGTWDFYPGTTNR